MTAAKAKSALKKVSAGIEKFVAQVTIWLKRGIALALLVLIAITCLQLLGVSISDMRGITLNQDTGIGVAGLAYLYSRL